MSRHRIRYLAKEGRYVCSKRYCPYTSSNLTEALVHASENKAVAPKQESTDAKAA